MNINEEMTRIRAMAIQVPATLKMKPEKWFKKMAWHTFGYCISFEMPPEIKKLNVRSYKIKIIQKYKKNIFRFCL